jgi:hypothetical protein
MAACCDELSAAVAGCAALAACLCDDDELSESSGAWLLAGGIGPAAIGRGGPAESTGRSSWSPERQFKQPQPQPQNGTAGN